MDDYFQRSRALRFLTAGREISVVYNRLSGMRGWDGSPCSPSAMQNRERFWS